MGKRKAGEKRGVFLFRRHIDLNSTQSHVSPVPTPGFKLKRGKLIQSFKFIGWKSSRRKRASSLQGRSCSEGLTLSYLLLDVQPFPPSILLFFVLLSPSLSLCLYVCLPLSPISFFFFYLSPTPRVFRLPSPRIACRYLLTRFIFQTCAIPWETFSIFRESPIKQKYTMRMNFSNITINTEYS